MGRPNAADNVADTICKLVDEQENA
jgi:hypothetical protein